MFDHVLNAAKPAHSFEREGHLDCLSCGRPIVHPLCADCIAKGFFQWARSVPKYGSILCENVRSFLAAHRLISGTGVRCISCNQRRTSLCPSCFTDILERFVRDIPIDSSRLNEFLFIFDFEFEQDGASA